MKINIGHSIKDIAEALKIRNSIFRVAIDRGAVNIHDTDVQAYLDADSQVVKAMDTLHCQLIKEEI